MTYKVTLNGRTYEVEVEAGKAMLLSEYEAVAPAPVVAAPAAPVAAPAPKPAAAPAPKAEAPKAAPAPKADVPAGGKKVTPPQANGRKGDATR